MKNYFYLLIFFLVFSNKSFGQKETLDTSIKSVVLNDYELSDKQFSAWKIIQNNWLGGDYEAIKMANNIKLNYKNCDAFYLDLISKINANGKLEYCKLVNSNVFDLELTNKFELRFVRMFFKFELPPDLRNMTFKTRLGNVLKC